MCALVLAGVVSQLFYEHSNSGACESEAAEAAGFNTDLRLIVRL